MNQTKQVESPGVSHCGQVPRQRQLLSRGVWSRSSPVYVFPVHSPLSFIFKSLAFKKIKKGGRKKGPLKNPLECEFLRTMKMSCQKQFVCLSVSLPRPTTLSPRPVQLESFVLTSSNCTARGSCAAQSSTCSSILPTAISLIFQLQQPLLCIGRKGGEVTEQQLLLKKDLFTCC